MQNYSVLQYRQARIAARNGELANPDEETRIEMQTRLREAMGIVGTPLCCFIGVLALVYGGGMDWLSASIFAVLIALPARYFFGRL